MLENEGKVSLLVSTNESRGQSSPRVSWLAWMSKRGGHSGRRLPLFEALRSLRSCDTPRTLHRERRLQTVQRTMEQTFQDCPATEPDLRKAVQGRHFTGGY